MYVTRKKYECHYFVETKTISLRSEFLSIITSLKNLQALVLTFIIANLESISFVGQFLFQNIIY